MPLKLKNAVLQTLIYSDVFQYPLNLFEIHQRLIGTKASVSEVNGYLQRQNCLKHAEGYFFLEGRRILVKLRKYKEKVSTDKIFLAERFSHIMSKIPSVEFIGLTGGVAANNSSVGDDIDFLIVTSPKLLWITRFACTLIAEIFGQRRRPDDQFVGNKICLNMYLAANHLEIPVHKRNLFSAYEILQMKPMFDRRGVHRKFLAENDWLLGYLPNFRIDGDKVAEKKTDNRKLFTVMKKILERLEPYFMKLQMYYMRKRRTNEVVNDRCIFFHPKDLEKETLDKFRSRCMKYKCTAAHSPS